MDLICSIFIEYSIRLVKISLLIKRWHIAISLINTKQYYTTYFEEEK